MDKRTGWVRVFPIAENTGNDKYFLGSRGVNVKVGIYSTGRNFKHERLATTWG